MPRRLFTILSALSLLVCLAVVSVAIRSYYFSQAVYHTTMFTNGHRKFSVSVTSGEIFIIRVSIKFEGEGQAGVEGFNYLMRDDVSEGWGWTSVQTRLDGRSGKLNRPNGPRFADYSQFEQTLHTDTRRGYTVMGRGTWIAIRWWLIAPVTLVMPTLWLRKALRAKRMNKLGLCPACGYDLRATPGRCPECGRETGGDGVEGRAEEAGAGSRGGGG